MKLKVEFEKTLKYLNLPKINLTRKKGNSFFRKEPPEWFPAFFARLIKFLCVKKTKRIVSVQKTFSTPLINIRPGIRGCTATEELYHEVGHYFYHYYLEDLKKQKSFHELFGECSRLKYKVDLLLYVLVLRDYFFKEDHPDYISQYARSNVKEDWAETFIIAMATNDNHDYGSKVLNKKVAFIKRMIKKHSKKRRR